MELHEEYPGEAEYLRDKLQQMEKEEREEEEYRYQEDCRRQRQREIAVSEHCTLLAECEAKQMAIDVTDGIDLTLLAAQCDYMEGRLAGRNYSTTEERDTIAGIVELLAALHNALSGDN